MRRAPGARHASLAPGQAAAAGLHGLRAIGVVPAAGTKAKMARQKRAGAVYGFLARLPGKWVSLTVDRQTGELVNALIYTE